MGKSHKPTPVVLNRFGLISGDHLTNSGEVLFGNTRPVTLKAAVFASDEKLTFLDMKLYEDNVINLLKTAEEYIKGNHESAIRNETIAKILYLNKSIEQFGSGFKRIDSLKNGQWWIK